MSENITYIRKQVCNVNVTIVQEYNEQFLNSYKILHFTQVPLFWL